MIKSLAQIHVEKKQLLLTPFVDGGYSKASGTPSELMGVVSGV